MKELYLQAVIVKKPMALGLARKKAQEFINNPKKRFVRETEDSYRFRNLPKGDFEDFVSKKINEEISLVMGHLKPEPM